MFIKKVILFLYSIILDQLRRLFDLLCTYFYVSKIYLIARKIGKNNRSDIKKPRLVWGHTPLANNIYWSRAMKQAGYSSETFTTTFYEIIHTREDWDLLMTEKYPQTDYKYKPYLAFIESLKNYDVFFISFDGYFLGGTPLWKHEAYFLKLARKKVVVIPYGGDAYVYNRIASTSLIHGLLLSYPMASKIQTEKAERLDYWVQNADFVIPGVMGMDGFGRWDLLAPSSLAIDTHQWKKSQRNSDADGKNGIVNIAHAPNHRGFKGTEFVLNTIEELKQEGYKINLILIEKMKNADLKKKFETEVDILIEQLIFTGMGLNGIEGMASGLCVISNLEDEAYTLPFRRWSFLSECPIVSATPENLKGVLIKLITRPELRKTLSECGRNYVEKYHSLEAAQYVFSQIIEYLYDRREPMLNFFHPLTGEFYKGKNKIVTPLHNSKITD